MSHGVLQFNFSSGGRTVRASCTRPATASQRRDSDSPPGFSRLLALDSVATSPVASCQHRHAAGCCGRDEEVQTARASGASAWLGRSYHALKN